MSDLSPRAKELIEKARQSEQPSDADLERNLSALRMRIAAIPPPDASEFEGPNVPPSRTPHGPSWSGPRGLSPWISGVAVGVGLAIGAGYLSLSETNIPPPPPSLPAPVPAPAVDRLPERPAPAEVKGSSERLEKAAAPSLKPKLGLPAVAPSAAAETSDRLAEEVRLLTQATSALSKGNAALSLRSLDEHQRLFPKGALGAERRAARAQALCLLGRTKEAETELRRLNPTSIQASRAREFCRALQRPGGVLR